MQRQAFTSWYRANYPRLLAVLARKLSDLALAEDALSEACLALSNTPNQPDDPCAWVYRVALNAAVDQKRKSKASVNEHALADLASSESQTDDRLALIFLCAHPSLSPDSQAMLMLRYALGLDVTDIALWFGADEDSVRRRLHRAKEKIQSTRPSFDLPPVSVWPERLPPVLSTLEVLFDQSYSNVGGGSQVSAFAREAEQLALQLVDLLPSQTEALGLAAMICFAQARRPARLDPNGALIPLDQQDTALWDDARIVLATQLLSRAAKLLQQQKVPAGSYVLRAMISAQHSLRKATKRTPWKAIVQLYRALLAIEPSLQARINFALAYAHTHGPAKALAYLTELKDQKHLALFLASAHLHQQLDQNAQALSMLDAALNMPMGLAERKFVQAQHVLLTGLLNANRASG
jgi:RNA polymerase sigma-70 factor, ECF subfamily